MKAIILLITTLISFSAFSGEWENNQTIYDVGIKYGNGCVTLQSGAVIKIDLTTDAGKAEYALALAAFSSGKTIDIYRNDNALVGGCDTGATIKPHSMLTINK